MTQLTEDLTIEDRTYTLKTALGWYETQQIEQSGFRLFADGKSVSQADDIASIPMLEIKIDAADAMLKKLTTWLVADDGRAYKAIDAMKITASHVPIIMARIAQLEAAQAEAVKALSDEHPLTMKPPKPATIEAPLNE